MFIVFKDGTVHETCNLKLDHKEGIAEYNAQHDNDFRQVNLTNIKSFSDIYPTYVVKEKEEKEKKIDVDLIIG